MGQVKKMCKACGKEKPVEDFYASRVEKDGLYCRCKSCNKEAYRKNKEKHQEYYKKNKDKIRDNRKKNESKSKDRIWEYYQKNKDRIRAYYQKNKDRIVKACREYKRKNRDKTTRRIVLRYRTCMEFRIKMRLCGRIRNALRGCGKSAHTRELVGCSVSELMVHLESMFRDGMSWDNYGNWHIDHIKPCASFDLVDPEQQRICFNWKNLQPLWATENIAKGDKYAA